MITKIETEYNLGPVDAFSEQVVRSGDEDDGSYFYTIFKGKFHIYISEYPSGQYDDTFLTTIFINNERVSAGFGCDNLRSIFDWIKKQMNV
jgi:hypothetical protein